MRPKKNNLFIVTVLCFLFISCKKELINDESFIRNLSNDLNFEMPLHNEALIILINTEGDSIYATSLRQLNQIRKKNYDDNFKNFDDFLVEVLNNNLLFKSELLENSMFSFKLDKNISQEFRDKGISFFKEKYCEKSKVQGKYYIKRDLNLTIKYNIMYFFFKSNYYIMQNDYSGNDVLIDKNKR